MKLKIIVLALALSGTLPDYARNPDINHSIEMKETEELKAAKKVLLNYLKAGDESNVTELNKLTHEHYRVIYNDVEKGEVSKIDKPTYLDLIKKNVFGGKPRKVEIISKDSSGENIASFKVRTSSEGGTFVSYFSLIKLNGSWQIVQDLIYKNA